MSSEFGNRLRVSVFGQSHGRAVGVVVSGLPAGETIDMQALARFMDRRRPGKNRLSTARKETDEPQFLSGLENGMTCGAPLCAVIENGDARSADYAQLQDKPRPSHADYTAYVKWGGHADMRGGGHFSARLTAPLCVAGGIAKQLLEKKGVFVGAHVYAVAGIGDEPFPMEPTRALFEQVAQKAFPVLDDASGERMQAAILDAARDGDSVGGVIECAAIGLEAGLGEPMFDGVENRLAAALFGIPAVKGVEFGSGFACAQMRGSAHNDPFTMAPGGQVRTVTNHSGGIQGGITNGMPVVVRLAVKPTPSIAKTQQTISLSRRENAQLAVTGRHDPCVALRAVPVVEAVVALTLLDLILEESKWI